MSDTKVLDKKIVSLIKNATDTAYVLGVESLIVDSGGVRGYNKHEGIIIAELEELDIPFERMGLSRLDSLRSRMALLNKQKGRVEAQLRKNGEDVLKLVFKGERLSFEFRCSDVKNIKDIPSKKLNDDPYFTFYMTEEEINTISQGRTAMRAENMYLAGNEDGVVVKLSDTNGDILTCDLDTDLDIHTEKEKFHLTLNVKKMLPVFKSMVSEGNARVDVIKNDILAFKVNGLKVFMMPEV